MKIRPVVKGLLSYVPGMQLFIAAQGSGGSDSAYYCYGVWLKHLTFLSNNGLRSIPNTLAELGPGGSLGVGLAAMLCGVNHYYALDVVRHTNVDVNLKILDDLVALFRSRAERPTKGWPDFDDYLDDGLFPSHILSDALLETSLSENRIAAIRDALKNPEHNSRDVTIKYQVPWSDERIIEKESVDVILSHSVLEHVIDLEETYQALYSWLKPNGIMTHQIDFTSHGLSKAWNGYREYSEFWWRIIAGKRGALINRQPYSVHIEQIKKSGFTLVCDLTRFRDDGIQRADLSEYWQTISDQDLSCEGAFLQAIKSSIAPD